MPDVELSVIVPTLNEQAVLDALLADLGRQRRIALQVIVADGGSNDATMSLTRQAGVELVASPPGRGRQMNAGRRQARGDWLLFLHADSRLGSPLLLSDALRHLQAAGPAAAGHFGLRFAARGHRRFFAHLERKSRSGRPETINGDQGLMIHQRFFDRLGGFDERLPFLEDQAISQHIFRQGRWLLLPGELSTSARRFESEGVAARYVLMGLIMCARRSDLDTFFEQARGLYAQQGDTERLQLLPFYDLLLTLGEEQPRFWPSMADYARDNLWQLGFAADSLLGRELLTSAAERLAAALPPAAFRRVAAPLLRGLFRGPVRAALARHEAADRSGGSP